MKIILIDDEQLALDYMKVLLSDIPDLQIIGSYTDPFDAKAAVESSDVDIVFLDIRIPHINGMELAERLLEQKPRLHIVFVSAYANYAIKAFELDALDYILKPVSKQRLEATIQRIHDRISGINAPLFNEQDALQMTMFQQVSIAAGDQPVELHWRSAKVKQLFLFLVHNRGRLISKAALIELFWPKLELKKALQQLYTAVYYIRQTLGDYVAYFKLHSTSEGYSMSLEQITLDVDQFDQFIQSRTPITVQTINHYEQALSLYTDEYLMGYDYVWAESERHRLQMQWLQTALKIVDWYYSRGELSQALTLCLSIQQRFPLEEEAYFFLMRIFADTDKPSAVRQQYDSLKTILLEELQVKPGPTIIAWYNQWRKKNKQ